MPSSQNNSGGGQSQQSSQSKPMSNYEFVKPWGGMMNFMLSYGIKPTPEGFEEANALIEQFKAQDAQN
ncbi:hypothetical protein QBC39DRAFT_369385 [Podospora conica]|nr:hypothetical protein QBC39DRAFT_369385 [Schizothecium conicum]